MDQGKSSITTNIDDQPEEQVKVIKDNSNSNAVFNTIAESVTVNIASLVNANFIKPYTCSLVNEGITGLTSGLNKSIEDQITSFKCERRTEFLQNKDTDNRVPDEFKKAHEDKDVMKEVERDIDNFANDEKVGLQHLGSVSDACGCAIKVLDENGNLIRIIGDTSSGKIAEVQYKDGHYSLPNGEDPPGGSTKPNDCLFNVIAHQNGETDPKKIAEMRSKTVEAMHKNINILAHQHADVQYLKNHDRNVLHEGGTVNPRKTKDDAKKKKAEKFYAGLSPEKQKKLQEAHTYEDFDEDLRGRDGVIEVHHEPPGAAYDPKVDKSDKLCVALPHDDHRNLLSTGNAAYVESIKDIISKDKVNGFSDALLIGCLDIHLTSLRSGSGNSTVIAESLVDAHASNGKLTPEQAKVLKDKIKNFPTKPENFTTEYLSQHKDSFNNGTNALKLFEAKVNDEKVKVHFKKPKKNVFVQTSHRKEKAKKAQNKEKRAQQKREE